MSVCKCLFQLNSTSHVGGVCDDVYNKGNCTNTLSKMLYNYYCQNNSYTLRGLFNLESILYSVLVQILFLFGPVIWSKLKKKKKDSVGVWFISHVESIYESNMNRSLTQALAF